MELLFKIVLFISGLVIFLPGIILFLPSRISDAYEIPVPEKNEEVLLRHRAVFFGITGAYLMLAAVMGIHLLIATAIGFISMMSFVILCAVSGPVNQKLKRVMQIDAVLSVALLASYLLFRLV